MNDRDDPLYRAVARGDSALPDGRALARLGDLLRDGARPPRPVDLWSRVRAAIAEEGQENAGSTGASQRRQAVDPASADADTDAVGDDISAYDAELIDAWYNGDRAAAVAADPLLERLGSLVRQAARPPRYPDLLPRVVSSLQRQHSSRRLAPVLDRVSRWRIWTAVVAGHAAAFMALAAIHVSVGRSNQLPAPELMESRLSERPGYHRLNPTRLHSAAANGAQHLASVGRWEDLRAQPQQLLSLRSDASRRAEARRAYGAQSSTALAQGATNWLLAARNADGTVGPAASDLSAQVAVQAAVAYALLGEGLDESERFQACEGLLGWLADTLGSHGAQLDGRAHGLAFLALSEGALLFDDPLLKGRCEELYRSHGHHLLDKPGEAGVGGFGWLAVEIAALSGQRLPDGLRQRLQRGIAQSLPSTAADPGRLGVAAFSRQSNGAGNALSTGRQLNALMDLTPGSAAGRLDLLAWVFPTMALRETRDRRWQAWNSALESTLGEVAHVDDQGRAHIPGHHMRYHEGFGPAASTIATALALMTLQAPYRYLPLRH